MRKNERESSASNEVTVEVSYSRATNEAEANSLRRIHEVVSCEITEGNNVDSSSDEDHSEDSSRLRRLLSALSDELWSHLVFGSLRWLYSRTVCGNDGLRDDLEAIDIVVVIFICVILGIIFGFFFAVIAIALFYG